MYRYLLILNIFMLQVCYVLGGGGLILHLSDLSHTLYFTFKIISYTSIETV